MIHWANRVLGINQSARLINLFCYLRSQTLYYKVNIGSKNYNQWSWVQEVPGVWFVQYLEFGLCMPSLWKVAESAIVAPPPPLGGSTVSLMAACWTGGGDHRPLLEAPEYSDPKFSVALMSSQTWKMSQAAQVRLCKFSLVG